jgi:hypothetical protein
MAAVAMETAKKKKKKKKKLENLRQNSVIKTMCKTSSRIC